MSTPHGPGELIRAAGGVVWRRNPGVEVVLVRRDRYDDWSLPKGKLHPGETHKAAALREVHEETGLECELGAKLTTIDYDTLLGPKRVKWWAMTPKPVRGDEAQPAAEDPGEVAEARWLPFEDAWMKVTYGSDREVLVRFAEALRRQ